MYNAEWWHELSKQQPARSYKKTIMTNYHYKSKLSITTFWTCKRIVESIAQCYIDKLKNDLRQLNSLMKTSKVDNAPANSSFYLLPS